MASTQVQKLLVDLEARTARFEQGMSRAQRSLRRTEKHTAMLNKGFALLSRTLGTFGVAVGVGGIVSMTRNLVTFASEIDHVADRLPFTADEIQGVQAAAEAAGITLRNTELALQRFARRFGEAQKNSGELAVVLRELGISTELTAAEAFDQLALSIQNAETQQEALRIAFKAFDSEGAALVSVLQEAGFSLEEATRQAEEMGLVLDEKVAAQLESLGTALDQQIRSWKVWGATALGAIKEILDPEYDLAALERNLEASRHGLERWQNTLDAWEGNPISDAIGATDFARAQVEAMTAAVADLERKINDLYTPQRPSTRSPGAPGGYQLGNWSTDIFLPENWEAWTTTVETSLDTVEAKAVRTFDQIDRAQERVTTGFADELARALVTGEANFKRFAESVIADILRIAIRQQIIGGFSWLGGTGFGNLGHILPRFAQGGIVGGPSVYRGAMVAEQVGSPEAVLPLRRLPSGDLGVAAAGGGTFSPSVVVNMNGPATPGSGEAIGAAVVKEIRALWEIEARNQSRVGGALNPV